MTKELKSFPCGPEIKLHYLQSEVINFHDGMKRKGEKKRGREKGRERERDRERGERDRVRERREREKRERGERETCGMDVYFNVIDGDKCSYFHSEGIDPCGHMPAHTHTHTLQNMLAVCDFL